MLAWAVLFFVLAQVAAFLGFLTIARGLVVQRPSQSGSMPARRR